MCNTTEQEKKLKDIMSRANLDLKHNYSIYHNYRRMIEDLELNPKEFESAIRELAVILKV